MTNLLLILAQATQATQPAQGSPPSGMEIFLRQMLPLILVIGVFFWWMSRSRGKERQNFEKMLNALKRNDRVQTIGGVLGTVVEVRGSEVILKVDEANNVKMHFNRSAIKEVLREGVEGDSK
jgi:preprotein translocase subunit YajC